MNKESIKKNRLTQKVIKSMAWMFGGTIMNVVLQLLFLAILARYLSPKEYGVIALCLVIISFSSVVTQMGVGLSLIQRKELSCRHVDTAFSFSLIAGILVSLLIISLSDVLAVFFEASELAQVLPVISLIFILKGSALVSEAMITRNMQFKWLAMRNVIAYLLGYGGVGIFLAKNGASYWALVYAHIAQELFKAIFLIFQSPPNFKLVFHYKELKELLSFGIYQTYASLLNRVATEGDSVVIAKNFSGDQLGVYAQAYRLMAFPAVLMGEVISKVLFPAFSSIQDNKAKLRDIQLKGIFLTSFLVLPICMFVYALSDEIVAILLGDKWSEVSEILCILAIGIYFRVGYKINAEITKSVGRSKVYAMSQAIYAFFVVALTYAGSLWGLEKAAAGVVLALMLNFFMMLLMGCTSTGARFFEVLKVHVPGGIASSIFVVFFELWNIYFKHAYIYLNVIVSVVFLLASYALTVIVMLRFSVVYRETIIWLYHSLKKFLGKKGSV